jgi:hypothetical protein
VKLMTTKLPSAFADLEPFVDDWALATETERYTKRLTTPIQQIQAFYDAIFPRGAEVLDYLDQYSLDNLPDEALNLLRLMYSLVCISIAVEAWGQGRIPDTGASEILCFAEPIP